MLFNLGVGHSCIREFGFLICCALCQRFAMLQEGKPAVVSEGHCPSPTFAQDISPQGICLVYDLCLNP